MNPTQPTFLPCLSLRASPEITGIPRLNEILLILSVVSDNYTDSCLAAYFAADLPELQWQLDGSSPEPHTLLFCRSDALRMPFSINFYAFLRDDRHCCRVSSCFSQDSRSTWRWVRFSRFSSAGAFDTPVIQIPFCICRYSRIASYFGPPIGFVQLSLRHALVYELPFLFIPFSPCRPPLIASARHI